MEPPHLFGGPRVERERYVRPTVSRAAPSAHALVTGGATGIGRATVQLLARRGDEVALHYRSHAKEAKGLAEDLSRERGSGRVWPVRADLLDRTETHALADAVAERFPSLEALVLNAGEYPRRSVTEVDEEAFERTLRLNLLSPYSLIRRLLPLLRRASPGPARVVLVSSVLAFQGSDHGADYAASKAGLLGLAKSLARELAPGVLVNVVAPGTIDTAIMAYLTPEQRIARGKAIPLGRIGTPEDVAEVIAFLTSPSATYMTGTTVHVNGGLRMD
jgi:3-oxoacyl-[acyl-carrier protein] reductase